MVTVLAPAGVFSSMRSLAMDTISPCTPLPLCLLGSWALANEGERSTTNNTVPDNFLFMANLLHGLMKFLLFGFPTLELTFFHSTCSLHSIGARHSHARCPPALP